MSKILGLLGLCVWIIMGLYDWWAWNGLLHAGLAQLGALIGFSLLAIISIPVTVVLFIVGLAIMVSDE